MRLFLAVEVDEDTRNGLSAVVRGLAEAMRSDGVDPDRFVWVPPRLFHVTVHFLGELGEHDVEKVHALMKETLPVAPFEMEFGGVGFFPSAAHPKVLWLDVTRGVGSLVALHERLGVRLEQAGLTLEARPYRPHLTLGRFRRSSLRKYDALGRAPLPPVRSCTVGAVSLYESRAVAEGRDYTVQRRALLEG